MTDVYFPVTANYTAFAPDIILNGDVLFTPEGALSSGFVPFPVPAKVMGGELVGFDDEPSVQLLAGESLSYLVTFYNFTAIVVGFVYPTPLPSFRFAAPLDASPVDLITVARLT